MVDLHPITDQTGNKLSALQIAFIFAALFTLLLSVLLTYEWYQAAQRASAVQIRQEEIQRFSEQKKDEFNDILNDMIQDIAAKAVRYNQQRITLDTSIEPYNFETPEYAAESHKLFISTVAPALRKSANEIIGVFETYDAKIRDALSGMPEDAADILWAEWKTMRKEQSEKYVNFFMREDEIIEAHQNLIKFYAEKAPLFAYDENKNKIIFEYKADAQKESDLQRRIKDLQSRRSDNTLKR